MEIERKWLVTGFPENEGWPCIKRAQVRQGYIALAPTVRIRETHCAQGSSYILCIKGKGTLAREEVETPLTAETFAALTAFTGTDLVTKEYRVYALPSGHKLEVSHVDAQRPEAFFYAEVEFTSVEQAHAFVPPAFLGEEKTEDGSFSMSRYWQKTRGFAAKENCT